MDPVTATQSADSIGQLIAGGGLVLSGGLILKLLELAQKFWLGKNQKTQVGPQPFEVKRSPDYADKIDFKAHIDANQREHENLFGRVSILEQRTENTATDLASIKSNLGKVDTNIDRLIWRLIPESRTEGSKQ